MGSTSSTTASEPEWTWKQPHRNPLELPGELGSHMLVVEDEHLVALDIQLGLERMGYQASVVYSGEEALRRITETRFDLILMDIKLTGKIDGIDTAGMIQRAYDVPVIYLTAYADNRTLERARATEPYGYVLKPFQERELKATIEMALQRHTTDRFRLEQQQLQRFLADASTQLSTTLDYKAVALYAAELLVPRRADWCALRLKETNDWIPAFMFSVPEDHAELIERDVNPLIDSVLAGTSPEIVTQFPDDSSAETATEEDDADHNRDKVSLSARSLVCVPLLARDRILGALAIVCGPTRPRYTLEDLLFLKDFGHRLGLALDNALLYRKAERAIHMRDDVLAIVSHDLRTPLGTVLMQAESLNQSPQRRVGDAIARSAQRMNRLIGDLLDASSLNAGKLALDTRNWMVSEIVDEAVDMFRSQAEAHGIELSETIPDQPLSVVCDRDRIGQVLSNLIGNAIKFTGRGGRVLVQATSTGDSVRIEVRDTGRGIPAEQVPHLFDRFWRAQAHRHGAGLGLFIARGILAAHGSTLEVETTLGRGSCFHFTLRQDVPWPPPEGSPG
jgi:signal transduction histidine kinase/CheY-like chemotaxis protein